MAADKWPTGAVADLVQVDLQGPGLGCDEAHEQLPGDLHQHRPLLQSHARHAPAGTCSQGDWNDVGGS